MAEALAELLHCTYERACTKVLYIAYNVGVRNQFHLLRGEVMDGILASTLHAILKPVMWQTGLVKNYYPKMPLLAPIAAVIKKKVGEDVVAERIATKLEKQMITKRLDSDGNPVTQFLYHCSAEQILTQLLRHLTEMRTLNPTDVVESTVFILSSISDARVNTKNACRHQAYWSNWRSPPPTSNPTATQPPAVVEMNTGRRTTSPTC